MKIVKYRNGSFELEDGSKFKVAVFDPHQYIGMEVEDFEKLFMDDKRKEGIVAVRQNNE